MAHFVQSQAPVPHSLRGVLSRLVAAVAAWREERVAREQLAQLTDRELSDIGLLRADLDAEAPLHHRDL